MLDPQTVIAFFEKQIPFNAHLGMTVELFEPKHVVLKVPFKPELVGDPFRPALHGGVMSTLIDAAGGLAVFTTLDQLGGLATVDLRVDYLEPGRLEDLFCEAKVIRVGNRVAVTSMQILQGSDRTWLAAEGRGVYNILRPDRGGS